MSDKNFDKIGTIESRCMEECAELIHILAKVQRFGWTGFDPKNPDVKNDKLVISEVNDLKKVINELENYILSLDPNKEIKLTSYELEYIQSHPDGLRLAAYYNDAQETMADAMGDMEGCVKYHQGRSRLLNDMANKLDNE